MMSSHPSKLFPCYCLSIGLLVVLLAAGPGLCKEEELSELQKQARKYRAQGLDLQQEGHIEEAIPYYQRAIALDPAYVVVYNDLGIVYEAAGYPDRAKEMYLKAIELDPNYPNSYANLALFYEDQKDYPNAIICWLRRALLGGPGDTWAETARKRLGDIAEAYPEAFRNIGEQYKENLQQLTRSEPALSEFTYLQPEGKTVTLLQDEGAAGGKQDSKTRAVHYLRSAKESFYKGDYVTALKEATVASYLDPSNKEISDFVEKVRKTLLQ